MSTSQRNKLKVDIYVPTSRCPCEWQGFMDKVFEVLMPYLKEIDFTTKDSTSAEAQARKLPIECVVVGESVFMNTALLRQRLPTLIRGQDR